MSMLFVQLTWNFNNFDWVLCGFMLGSISWVEMGSVFLVSVFYWLLCWLLFDEVFHIARHLAAKFGTNSWFWFDGSSSLCVIEVVLFFLIFLSNKCYFIGYRWFSAIKISFWVYLSSVVSERGFTSMLFALSNFNCLSFCLGSFWI